jgi:hypothetical protein
VTDLVAFKLPSIAGNNVNVTSIALTEWGEAAGHSNVSVLVGGNSSTTLASLAGLSISQLEADGFHLLQFDGTGNNAADGSRTITSTTADTNGGQDLADFGGSILIVAASLNDPTTAPDFVKVASIGATSTPVPEPATVAMFGFGLAGLFALRRRRKKQG